MKCDTCPATFHVSCAWLAGYRFSFEILPIKEEWSDVFPQKATFKEETGDMRAIITCKSHAWNQPRLLYDLGQKDRSTNLVSLLDHRSMLTTLKWIYIDGLDDICKGKAKRQCDEAEADCHSQYTKQELAAWVDLVRYMDLGVAYRPLMTSDRQRPSEQHHRFLPLPAGFGRSASTLILFLPDATSEVYSQKAPYIKPIKPKKKKAAKTLTTALPIDTAPVSVPDKSHSSSHNAINDLKVNSGPPALPIKKRKRRNSETSQDATLSLTSEDEIMPTASTSRARGAARPSRGVSLKDILVDEGNPHPSRRAEGKSSKHEVNGKSAVPSSSWGFSKVVDGRTVWESIDEDVLRSILLGNSHSDNQDSRTLNPEELVKQDAHNRKRALKVPDDTTKAQNRRPWQVLSLPALSHAYSEMLYQRSRYETPPSVPLNRGTTSSSSSSVTLPMGDSPQSHTSSRTQELLQIARNNGATPVFMAKTESMDSNSLHRHPHN